jgi:hypothetical protein
MTVSASLSGAGFSGPREVHVPAGGTSVYPLSFTAPIAGAWASRLILAPMGGELLARLPMHGDAAWLHPAATAKRPTGCFASWLSPCRRLQRQPGAAHRLHGRA